MILLQSGETSITHAILRTSVTGHVVEAVAVGRVRLHRRGALVAVGGRVAVREFALPDVAEAFCVRERLVTPDVGLGVEAAARGEFPFSLRRQSLAGPLRISR